MTTSADNIGNAAMGDPVAVPPQPSAPQPSGQAQSGTTSSDSDAIPQQPEYSQLVDQGRAPGDASLGRFFDVEVSISAEIGRVSLPIGEIVKLGEGSVVNLDRPVNSPVDVMAQGVRIATGEVVIIDDHFAVRIKSIESEVPAD